jgi:MoxR-like ATPase
MFTAKGISQLLTKNKKTLLNLVSLEATLNLRFADMEEAVRCLILSVAAGEPMLMIGPPGTGKSRLIRVFSELTGMLEEEEKGEVPTSKREDKRALREIERSPKYFSYLLTQFTEPSELFGYFDIGKLVNEPHQLVKLDEHSMQRARVVFLDEVFNASSAILNSLLTFMNEREIYDRGKIFKTPLQCLLSATNRVPESGELSAFYDRFLLRCWLENEPARPDPLKRLLHMGWTETHAPGRDLNKAERDRRFPDLLDGAIELQAHIEELSRAGDLSVDETSPLFATLADLVEQARTMELSDGSNRRLIKFTKVMLINRLLEYARSKSFKVERPGIQHDDLLVFLRFGLDRVDDSLYRRFLKEGQGMS